MLQCNGNILKIESSNLEKDLGIMIDSGLIILQSIWYRIRIMNYCSYQKDLHISLDLKCFNLLYKALVRPHLEYGVTIILTKLKRYCGY